ncbi:hypothetical protein [Polyangium aurulentum]|uniref:hypothetical protein n=1 Tax=Polyangium aurulentum TaxID=2567896 RepID=UPI0010ADF9BA|nr:hypothetical protein [Polyangium aurulentum]UQA58998.1 hypothetical protein E8A73_000300 [Polyangium aurulentum]
MPNPSHPELSRPAPLARRRWALAVSTALGLCAFAASDAALAEPQPAQPSPPAGAQPSPPAGAQPGDPAAAGAPQQQPPPGYGTPPPGYGYGAPPPGYGYPSPYYGYYGSAPPTPPPRFERNNTGMMVGGILLTSGGIVGILVGSALASTAGNQIAVYCESPGGGGPVICERRADASQLAAGYGVLIAGVVALGVGIPLWVIGGKRVPAKDQAAPDAPPPPSASMRLLVGPSSATLDVRF